jgi:hypothetical protein
MCLKFSTVGVSPSIPSTGDCKKEINTIRIKQVIENLLFITVTSNANFILEFPVIPIVMY